MKPRRARAVVRPTGAVRQELARLGRVPRKRLGQHFLSDPGVAQRIVSLAQLHGREPVVEIGPGLGALSDRLMRQAETLWLVEVDAALAGRLRTRYADQPHVHVVEADVLTVDLAALLDRHPPAVVVGNLPYNIATAVLGILLAQRERVVRMVLMLQREVAARLCAPAGSSAYSALSVLTQFAARVRPALRVAPEAFVPRPRVESEVVLVEPYGTPPVTVGGADEFTTLVRTVFRQRRKQLGNSLRPLCREPALPLRAAGIDAQRRPETLTLAEFAALSNALHAWAAADA